MMVAAKAYILIQVWMILAIIQGHNPVKMQNIFFTCHQAEFSIDVDKNL